MSKKVIIFIAVIAVAAAGFVWWKTRPAPALKYAGPVEKIVIAGFGERSVLNLIAKEEGFFEENGLDAQFKEFTSGPPAIAALLRGEVNVAPASDFTGVGYIFTNKNLRIISQLSEENTYKIIARKDKNISNPADFKGKTIGITKKTFGEFLLGQFLTANDLSLKDVSIVNLEPPEIESQIEEGQIDAAVAFEPYVFNIQEKMGDKIAEFSFPAYQNISLLDYSTDEFINAHPGIIERYLRALIKADKYVKENNASAKAITAKTLHYDDLYINYVWPKYSFGVYLEQRLLITMEDEARWAILNKLTGQTEVPNYLNFIYFDALAKVKPEAVTITR